MRDERVERAVLKMKEYRRMVHLETVSYHSAAHDLMLRGIDECIEIAERERDVPQDEEKV